MEISLLIGWSVREFHNLILHEMMLLKCPCVFLAHHLGKGLKLCFSSVVQSYRNGRRIL